MKYTVKDFVTNGVVAFSLEDSQIMGIGRYNANYNGENLYVSLPIRFGEEKFSEDVESRIRELSDFVSQVAHIRLIYLRGLTYLHVLSPNGIHIKEKFIPRGSRIELKNKLTLSLDYYSIEIDSTPKTLP